MGDLLLQFVNLLICEFFTGIVFEIFFWLFEPFIVHLKGSGSDSDC
jgi:hypothetical protein